MSRGLENTKYFICLLSYWLDKILIIIQKESVVNHWKSTTICNSISRLVVV